MGLLEDDRLRDSPILVLANKQDLPEAASPAEVTEKLGLYKLRSGRDWYVQRTTAVTGEGLVDGLAWLAEKIKSRRSHRLV
jgi:signal recognition particle receptor subunit beta